MTRFLSVALLLGSLLLIGAGFLHPILPLAGEADLALINATKHWLLIHQLLLLATGLIIAGVWARWLAAEPAERPGLAIAFVILGVGHALNGVNIAFMTGAGPVFAGLYAAGSPVADVYHASHMAVVMAGRLGGFLGALAAGIIAPTTGARATEPRWLVGLAWLACFGGLMGSLFARPGHPLMLTSLGLLAVWQLLTATRVLWGRH